MALDPTPSTDWAERPSSAEAARHQEFSDGISRLQTGLNRKYGPGRAFHRQQVAGLAGELRVTATEPELRQGLFAEDGPWPVRVRLSHGGIAPHADAIPDIQGFAISVRDIDGPGALADTTDRQDFLLINMPAFGFRSSEEFAQVALSRGPVGLAKDLIAAKGPVAGPVELARLTSSVLRPFTGFATTDFHSAAPIRFGPYAVKVRLVPVDASRNLTALVDQHGDIAGRLASGPLTYDLQVQFFVSEDVTPIEDMRDPWPQDRSPFHPVARLTLPRQDLDSEAGRELADEIERDQFDPWNALADHRPLGEVMRARKVAYYPSVRNRSAPDPE
ncbi:MAG: hypothetical protein U0R64_00450 [Candidatus Nanopelagicales bacterium]